MDLGQMLSLFILFAGIVCGFPVSETSVDVDKLPRTSFSCEGKVIGGYYADIESGCQMFHVCTLGVKGEIRDIKFLCLSGTVFDQQTRVCERLDEVNCSQSAKFYDLNLDLFGSRGTVLGRNAREGDGVVVEDEDAQATSITSDDHYVDYDNTEDSTIIAEASNERPSVVKLEGEYETSPVTSSELNPDLPLILNITGVTVTSTDPILPLIRKKKALEVPVFPQTDFSCVNRIADLLYADVQAGCQMYHVCTRAKNNRIVDLKFLCERGTLFDQVSRTCKEATQAKCDLSEELNHLTENFQLIGIEESEDLKATLTTA